MRLVTFTTHAADPRRERTWRLGILLDGTTDILDAALAIAALEPSAGCPEQYLDWFDKDGTWLARARQAHARFSGAAAVAARRASGVVVDASTVRVLAPVPRPGKIVCAGLNYRDHAIEAKMPIPESPVLFAKFASAVIGSGEPVVLPASSTRIDYEAELAVVIGRHARGVSREHALSHVLGYMNANDVSARDFQKLDGQWVRSKSCDSFAPMGPWLVTADAAGDPHALGIRLRLNGETMQDSSTRQFVFDIPALIAFLSATTTLEPGDVILTGTPPGVGFARTPPVYLAAGDVMEVEIDGLGILRNPVIGPAPATHVPVD